MLLKEIEYFKEDFDPVDDSISFDREFFEEVQFQMIE